MKMLFALGLSAMLSLSACASLPQAISAIGTAETVVSFAQTAWSKSGVTLFTVEATYGIIQTAVANFKKTECNTAGQHSWCPSFQAKIGPADAAVRDQFAKGEAFIKANPTLSPASAIAAAEGSVNAVAAIADSFGVKI